MKYKKLRIISYENHKNIVEEYNKRFNSYTTIRTSLEIFPFINENRKTTEKHELFYLPLQTDLIKQEIISYNSEKIIDVLSVIPGLAKQQIMFSHIIEEIQSTNDIEGVKSSKKEIGEAVINRKKKEKIRFHGIVNMYLNLEEKKYESVFEPEKLREIYDALFQDDIPDKNKPDGNIFRKGSVTISDNTKIVHRGNPNEESILEDIIKLIEFMNDKSVPFLIKCIISHYFFEYIHPFYDGNGRMGRFVMSSYISRKLDLFTGVSISNTVNKNKKKYSDSFAEVSHPKNFGEMTFFVSDMLDLILDGQEMILKHLDEAATKTEFVERYLNELNLEETPTKILFILIQNHLFRNFPNELPDKEMGEVTNLSRHLITKAYTELEIKGYVVKVGRNPIKHSLTEMVKEAIG